MGALHAQKLVGCVFCEIAPERVIAKNSLAFVIRDGFPVTPLHTLIISRRHVVDYFDLFTSEERALQQLVRQMRSAILQKDGTVSAFNVEINAGASAGQTVPCIESKR